MKSKQLGFGSRVRTITISILCLLVFLSSVGIALGQKRPVSLNQGTTPDDKKLCSVKIDKNLTGTTDVSEFCNYYNTYTAYMESDPAKARRARNLMIDLVQAQIETYYKDRKDGRKKTVAILQTIFDVLEISTAAATGIINGTLRAKSVMAQALSGFQAGRTAFNKNFDILETQVLINKMNSNRAEIALGIESKKPLNIEEYSWYSAKLDLIRLLNAGTFNDALDTLVKDSGNLAADAEKALADLKKERRIVGEPTPTEVEITEKAGDLVDALRQAYVAAADATKPKDFITEDQKKVLKKYQNIYVAIKANDLLFSRFNKIPDNPDISESVKTKFRGIISELTDPTKKVNAADYFLILGAFINTVAADETLGPAYLRILTDNK